MEAVKSNDESTIPSYYDAMTHHLRSYELSKDVQSVLDCQEASNANFSMQICDAKFQVLFNPVNAFATPTLNRDIKNIIDTILVSFYVILSESVNLRLSKGTAVLSPVLFDILKNARDLSLATNYPLGVCEEMVYGSDVASSRLKSFHSMKLYEDSKVLLPDDLAVNIDKFVEAWLVDNVFDGLRSITGISGCCVTYKGFSRVFGAPHHSSVWKCAVWGYGASGEQIVIGSVELDDEHPAMATYTLQNHSSDPFGMHSCTAHCQKVATAYALARVLHSHKGKETALRF
ncbi:hypothetical protein ERJ75_000111000 [Trypanosoma vivax]|nr:hypothetical protein ERJ75_000111000 [Trypanosoma vivax]